MQHNPQPHKPDLIKVAIEAAGGRLQAAKTLGVSPWTITNWQRQKSVQPAHIRPLCAAGGILSPEQLLAYIEANRSKVAA